MGKVKLYPKCRLIKKLKMDLIELNRDIFAKLCVYYIDTKNRYSDSVKHKYLRYYLEGTDFRKKLNDFCTPFTFQ